MNKLKDIPQQSCYRVLVIGDACLDEYVYGTIDRLSPEAPVPVFIERSRKTTQGMLGNVLSNLRNILQNSEFHVHKNDENLIKKVRFVETRSNYQIMRHDIEDKIAPMTKDQILDFEYDCVVISDYDKGFLNSKFLNEFTNNFSRPIFVDTKKSDLSCFNNSVIKINEKEKQTSHSLPHTSKLITTLGAGGAEFLGKRYPVNNVDVYDVCGAGDVFLSTVVARWLETRDIEQSIITANNCASFSVTKHGTYALTRHEYENLRV